MIRGLKSHAYSARGGHSFEFIPLKMGSEWGGGLVGVLVLLMAIPSTPWVIDLARGGKHARYGLVNISA